MGYTRADRDVTGRKAPRLLDQVRDRLRFRHYSLRTEQASVGWVRRFVLANGKRHPQDMGQAEVEAFLTSLARRCQISAGTQNQALAALLFLYSEVLRVDLPWMENLVRARRPRKIPVVLSQEEVGRLLTALEGPCWLMAGLLYGSGMRLLECLRLRIKDVEAARGEIVVRDGKGGKDRSVPLPARLRSALERPRRRTLLLHATGLAEGGGRVFLPAALARKYPDAQAESGWQFLFPAARLSTDPRSGRTGPCRRAAIGYACPDSGSEPHPRMRRRPERIDRRPVRAPAAALCQRRAKPRECRSPHTDAAAFACPPAR